ncbi:multicopper oxidase domain-containing protein [Leisingera daeponensis]|uniref:multicopper oxidase domain-containing protein n=1 Tax=Leisingera daeponensis TaxID=405746 RepID=UPI0028F6D938|nr:multicopper oxidase domain-containing protein [Leisingera daeponensis]
MLTANWLQAPVYDPPAGGLFRLRMVNTDTTRIYKLHLGTDLARIIVWDGHPVEVELPLPSAGGPLLVGPGQRVDFAVQMPAGEGETADLLAELPGQPARTMARLRSVEADLARVLRELKPLPTNPVSRPDLANAEVHDFVFGWTPEDGQTNDGYCGSTGYSFWSINRTPWAGYAAKGTGPLAVLERGKSYVLRLRNETPNLHPIHLHRLAFVPIRSNLRKQPPLVTDTMLLLKDEVAEIALVADNLGD